MDDYKYHISRFARVIPWTPNNGTLTFRDSLLEWYGNSMVPCPSLKIPLISGNT